MISVSPRKYLLALARLFGYNLAGQTKLASTFGEEHEHLFDYQ